MIWATVSSKSCFCWLYRASLSSATKNLSLLLTIWWCPCVELLEKGVCYDQQKEKRVAENEMVEYHHRFNGHELGQTLGDGEEQRGLVCCSPWDFPGRSTGVGCHCHIAKFSLKLKKVGKTIRPFRYDLSQIPYTVEVINRFKGLDLADRVSEEQ